MPVLHPDPPRIPPHLASELEVLKALRTLPPETHVFARLTILDPKTNRERELDFLVIHPELGLVIIEVKGRGVEPQGDVWIRRYRDERVEVLPETPGEQLHEQQYSLMNYLRSEEIGFIPQLTRVLALPALPLKEGDSLGPDLPACRLLTRAKLGQPFLSLRAAVSGGQPWDSGKRSPEGLNHQVRPEVMRRLVEVLSPRLLPPPSLAELLEAEGRLQDDRSRELLDHLALNFSRGRFHVAGGPGSGKSLLARQVTRLWAAEGRKVLHIAFNRALTYATQCALDDLVCEDRATVSTYHDLAVNLLDQAGRKPQNEDDSRFFNHQLPEGFNDLLAQPRAVGEKWDALVIDEAQDLDPNWVGPLRTLLRDPEHDPILLLEDPAQNLFREGRHEAGQPWRMDLSLRQHSAIRRAACLAFPSCGWAPPEELPDEGALRFVRSQPATWRRDLAAQLEGLAGEGLQPQQVMILSRRRPSSLGLKDGELLGPWRLNAIPDWWEEEKAGQVRMGSVQAFKGLEADVVIYLAPDYRDEAGPRLAYTAYSRARHRLIVLERAIARPAEEKTVVAPSAEVTRKAAPPPLRLFSEGERQNLMAALSKASQWRPGSGAGRG